MTRPSIFEAEDRRRDEARRHEEHARTVACPACNATVGASCITPGGRKRHYHTGRVLAVWRAERAVEVSADLARQTADFAASAKVED